MTAARLKPADTKESFSEERLEKYVDILRKADPTLRKMKVSYEEKEIAHQKIESDDFENREIIATKTTVGVETEHAMFENGTETGSTSIMFFADESLGTVKLFTALPYLYDTLEKGGVLIVDELENGLHLSLAKEIINLFTNSESNPHNAQLICCLLYTSKNRITGEEIYNLTLDCNDMVFHVIINKQDLLGEPKTGRRFKGQVWMQGTLKFEA